MSSIFVLLALTPLILIFVLLIFKKMPADVAGIYGLITTVLLAIYCFNTAPNVVAYATLSGVVGSLPVGLVLAASVFQISVMVEAGALASIASVIKTLVPGQKAVQVLLISVGFGILFTGLGAATTALLPPLLLTLGYTIPTAILLATLGYVAFCLYALVGIPAVIFAACAEQSLMQTGIALAAFIPAVSICVCFACLHVAGGIRLMRQGSVAALIAGIVSGLVTMLLARLGLLTLTAIIAGIAMVLCLLLYVRCCGKPVVDQSLRSPDDVAAGVRMPLWRATSPWVALIVLSLLMNTPSLPFFDVVFRQWVMPVTIIPNAPEQLRVFWQAYFWVFVSTILCLPLLRMTKITFAAACKKSLIRAWRPFVATAIYFAMAYIMNHSGKSATWELTAHDNNMIMLLAHNAAASFGTAYAAIAPYVGLLGGFITGSASSAVVMLTKLQLYAAQSIDAHGLTIAAGSSIGAGLAGAMSPAKLLSAGASIDKPDAANTVVGYAFTLTFGITVVCAALTYWWAF